MNAQAELIAAREALAEVLDQKLQAMPEWKALRAIDRALLAVNFESKDETTELRRRLARKLVPPRKMSLVPYSDLAYKAIEEKGAPLTTGEIIEYIGKRRVLGGDPDKTKVTISSSLSKDERLKNVTWGNGRGWWFAGRDVKPKIEPAKEFSLGDASP